MLALKLTEGQAVVLIDAETQKVIATVTLVRISREMDGSGVRLGFEASPAIQILREKLIHKLDQPARGNLTRSMREFNDAAVDRRVAHEEGQG